VLDVAHGGLGKLEPGSGRKMIEARPSEGGVVGNAFDDRSLVGQEVCCDRKASRWVHQWRGGGDLVVPLFWGPHGREV
jgi:hypothetical protein